MQTAPAFGQWLKQRRQELDLTQVALADATGCSIDSIRKIESGKRRPSRQVAELLIASLNLPPEALPAYVQWARGNAEMPILGVEPLPPSQRPIPVSAYQPHSTTYLPSPPTALVGREHEIAQVRNLLWRAPTRLVTLTGPPGVGKTRLCLAAASLLQGDFQDGLLFVFLAPVTEPALVVSTLAQALGVEEAPHRSLLSGLEEHLRDKHLLLVLDNFEQVVEAGPVISTLLSAAPRLKVLATSRIPLHIRGEKVLSVPPLAVPDRALPIEELSEVEGVALFVERVQDVQPGFALTAANARDVSAICARLEGLPLAIELAAAKLRILSLPDLVKSLQGRLAVLDDGPRDAPFHQQTLRRAIESSYDLLNAEEQKAFRRLGVFSGAFTSDGGEVVAQAGLHLLAALVDQSLLRPHIRDNRVTTGVELPTQFSMLETIQEYALERLEGCGEAETVRRSHADYYLALSEAANADWGGSGRKEWLERLESELNNLRSALHWMMQSGEIRMAGRMSAVLWNFWYSGGHISEGREELEKVLSLARSCSAGALESADMVTVLYAAGQFARLQDDLATQRLYYLESLAIARRLEGSEEDKKALSLALRGMSHLATYDGDYALARLCGEERLAIHRELEDEQGIAVALYSLGTSAVEEGRYELARSLLEESLVISRKLGAKSTMGATYVNLGEAARWQGDYSASRTFYEEGLAVWKELGNRRGAAVTLRNLGHVALNRGNYTEAISCFMESIAFHHQLKEQGSIAKCLLGFVAVYSGQGYQERAAKVSGAVDTLILATGVSAHLDRVDQVQYSNSLEVIRREIGEELFLAYHSEGAAMSLDEAIACVRDPVEPDLRVQK